MQPLLNIAVSAAKSAGEIIVRNLDFLDRIKPIQKKNNDYFSEVDIKAEEAIIRTIKKAYPDHGIIAEESGERELDSDVIWIIDPLDGTTNFLRRFPFFAVSIAVQIKGQIEHAVILDPTRHEYFTASRGRGARLNDYRIRVSNQTELGRALISSGIPEKSSSSTVNFDNFHKLLTHTSGIRRTGSAALDLAYVACGRIDGMWDSGLKPWDIAAGSLLIQEAGGFITDASGEKDFMETGDVIAATPKVHPALMKVLTS